MRTLQDDEFYDLVEFIRKNYGINLEHKRHLIEGRMTNVIAEKGFSSFREYLNYTITNNNKEELIFLINKLTTNHTYFMREEEHFEFFQSNVLPKLSETIKNNDLRIWSAGCSSGEEPYTLAMILEDFFGNRRNLWDKKLLATDISVEVLERAMQGIYTKDEIVKIDPDWRRKYFNKITPDSYKLKEAIKQEIIFRIFNLMDEFPFKKKFHVIFCRNVMIYFDQRTKTRLVNKFYDMTEKGGYLFIGMSESLRKDESPYKYVLPSVYRKE